MKYVINGTIIIMAFALAGCASAGKSFNYQNRHLIQIGKTTSKESVKLLGKPQSTHVESTTKGNFLQHNYSYAYANPSGASARIFVLEFVNDTLNGKVYNSGFKDDITSFNIDSATSIKAGKSTLQEVIEYLGEPSGKAFSPTAMGDFKELKCETAHTYCSWIHTRKSHGYDTSTIKTNVLIIAFDEKGIVCDLKSTRQF